MLLILPTDTCYGLAWSLMRDDYEDIYRHKWRDFTKPLALIVRSYEDMRKYIEISDSQIEYLRSYTYPWSFLWEIRSDFVLPEFMDPLQYTKLSLRIAENCIDANIRDNITYPLFLTSANLSWASESTTFEQAQNIFPWIGWINGWICNRPPSDIFSIGEDGNLLYVRRNYGTV